MKIKPEEQLTIGVFMTLLIIILIVVFILLIK